MTQTQVAQLQLQRIKDIIDNDIPAVNVALQPPTSIDTTLPLAVPYLAQMQADSRALGANMWNITSVWDIRLYISAANQSTSIANQMNLYAYIDSFFNAFFARKQLQLNGSNLNYVRDSDFALIGGLSDTQRYPPRNGQALYWGCQYRLTVYSTNITVQVD